MCDLTRTVTFDAVNEPMKPRNGGAAEVAGRLRRRSEFA
jgi:hypothetical protein